MERIIEDQDTQIANMRDKLQSKLIEDKQQNFIDKQMATLKSNMNLGLDYTETDIDRSANISRQINLENYKAGKIGPREQKRRNRRKVNKMALQDALNLSYQIISQDDTRREQSIIEDKITMSRGKGMKYLTPLISKNKEGNRSDSTTAEGDSKGLVSKSKLGMYTQQFPNDKASQSTILTAKKLQSMLETPSPNQNNEEPEVLTPFKTPGHRKNQESALSFGGNKILSPSRKFSKYLILLTIAEMFNKHSPESIKEVVEDAKRQNRNQNEDTILRDVFNNIGGTELPTSKPEISALQLNESEFNFHDDSQMNDIIEISNYAKPSEVQKFLDGNHPNSDNSLVQRFRKPAQRGSNVNNFHHDMDEDNENYDMPIEVHNDDIEDEPQQIHDAFLDLDTSGIDGDPDNQPFDKNFELDGDNSFVGGLANNNVFSSEPPKFDNDDEALHASNSSKVPITPHLGGVQNVS